MDTQQANRLVAQYSNMILRISYQYLKQTYDAEDICQTVFLKYLTKAPQCGLTAFDGELEGALGRILGVEFFVDDEVALGEDEDVVAALGDFLIELEGHGGGALAVFAFGEDAFGNGGNDFAEFVHDDGLVVGDVPVGGYAA